MDGEQLERLIARQRVVNDAVTVHTLARGHLAARVLKSHRHSGRAKITTYVDDFDGYITLDDPNAYSIEYGHEITHTDPQTGAVISAGRSQPVYALRAATR